MSGTEKKRGKTDYLPVTLMTVELSSDVMLDCSEVRWRSVVREVGVEGSVEGAVTGADEGAVGGAVGVADEGAMERVELEVLLIVVCSEDSETLRGIVG